MSDEITRSSLPAVVKRAAELATAEGEPEERISEAEVIRIAAELGLAERHVRAALYEGTEEPERGSFIDREFGVPRIISTRAVQMPTDQARRALEDYLVTCEYLQIVRRQTSSSTFHRADDAISRVARGFSRSRKHCLANAEAVEITTRELEPGWTHVRLKAVYPDARKSHIIGASVGTIFIGGPLGVWSAVATNIVLTDALGAAASLGVGTAIGLTAFSGLAVGMFSAARNNYRKWRERTRTEAEFLLDRLEKDSALRAPTAPWLRKLQLKLGRL